MIRLKNHDEIGRIRDACRILAETHKLLAGYVRPGITTLELDQTAHDFIVRHGAKPAFLGYMDYPASICASVNHVVIHGIPNGMKLREGDILSLDLGVDLGGYIGDSAVTYPVGRVGPEAEELLRVTAECLSRAIEQTRAGKRIHDVSRAVYDHAKEHGFGVVHQYCGHGVGFSLHEDPQVPNYVGRSPNPRLKPGMVLALEPMINIGSDDVRVLDDDWAVATVDGSLSAHFEHTVAIFEDRTEILTALD